MILGSKDKDEDDDKKDLSEYEKKRMTIEETKKSLPVYPFKQSLLDAIEEHQVLIIEGETGKHCPKFAIAPGPCIMRFSLLRFF